MTILDGAGVLSTTLVYLHQFLACMLLFPEVQDRAQEELDRVVGAGRLPTLEKSVGLALFCGTERED